MDNILDDVSLKWFNASEGEKYAGKRIIIMFMATLEKWIEFLGRVKGSTSHGTNLTLMSERDIFCAIWHLVLSHVNFDAWTSSAIKLSNYGKPARRGITHLALACGSRVTSRDSPRWRACSQATWTGHLTKILSPPPRLPLGIPVKIAIIEN